MAVKYKIKKGDLVKVLAGKDVKEAIPTIEALLISANEDDAKDFSEALKTLKQN